MPENVSNCPLCGSDQKKLFDQRRFRDQMVQNQICLNCGLVFQSPRMTTAELDVFYQQEYRQLYQGSDGPNPKDLAVQHGRAESLINFAQENLAKVSHHLDIGCSAGLLLAAFAKAYGCRSVGVEPGDAYREFAKGEGFTVYPALETIQENGRERFDLISLAHVLEHIASPVQYLAALRRDWLTADGYLLVEVPNLYCHDSFEVAHLVAYSPHSLTQTLQAAGFEVIGFKQHGQPRSQVLPLYLTALAHPGLNASIHQLKPERWVAAKRRYGLIHRRLLSRLMPRRVWLPADASVNTGL